MSTGNSSEMPEESVFKLVIEDDEGHTTVVPLVKDEITIGRKEGNTIRLTERNVSRHHARLIRSNGMVFIEDLDSYNGVKVNGGKITARTNIREGDLVEIGDYHLALQKMDELDAEPPAAGMQAQRPSPTVLAQAATVSTVADGATAVLRLPLEEKAAAEPVRSRPIPDDRAGRLVVKSTELAGQIFALNCTEITIGRTEQNDVVLAHRSVSSRHAKVLYDEGVYRIVDLDSANGVLVNGEAYARVDIREGDTIELGHVKLSFAPPGVDVGAVDVESQVATTPQPPAPARASSLGVPAELEDVGSRGGLGRKAVWGVGAAVVLGGIALGVMVLNPSGRTPSGEPGEQVDQPPAGEPTPTRTAVAAPTSTAPGKTAASDLQGDEAISSASEAADYFKQGLERMKEREWALAEQALLSCQTLDPARKDCKAMLARVQAEKQAGELFKQVKTSIEKRDWDEALQLLDDIPEGVQVSKQVADIRPEVVKKYVYYHLNRADRLEKTGNLKEAVKECDAVLVVQEDNQLVIERKKQLQKRIAAAGAEKKQQRAKARKSQPTPKKESGTSAVARINQAAALRKQGVDAYKKAQIPSAIALFQKSLKLNPKDHELHRMLGAAYARQGNRQQAYNQYKLYLEKCPQSMYAPNIRQILSDYEKLYK